MAGAFSASSASVITPWLVWSLTFMGFLLKSVLFGLCGKGSALDDDGFDRNMLVRADAVYRACADGVHHVHAGRDLAEYGVAVAVWFRVIESGIVDEVDEKLCGGR